jgi:hypothetical protein
MNKMNRPGEKFVNKILVVSSAIITTPVILAAVILYSPFYGVEKTIDFFSNINEKRKHEKKMKEDWYYKLQFNSKSINKAIIWQNNIDIYDQFIRKILAIYELDDIPVEIWSELLNSEDDIIKSKIKKLAIIYSCGNNKENIRKEIINYYIFKYKNLHNINDINDAHDKVMRIVKLEID